MPVVGSGMTPTTPARLRPWARMAPVAGLVLLVAAAASFHALGSGSLAPPPLAPGGWSAWVGARDPLVATFAILRLVVLGLAWYLLVAAGVGAMARLLRAARLVRVADALTAPIVRRWLQGALGLTVATAVATSAPGVSAHAWSGPPSGTAPVMSVALVSGVAPVAPDRSLAPSGVRSTPGRARPHPSPQAVDDPVLRPRPQDGRLILRSTDAPEEPASGQDRPHDDHRESPPTPEHEVVPGESFWSIAADRVAPAWPREPTDAQIATYWRRLIAANVDRLAVSEDPDLIFPGQRFILPDVARPGVPVGAGEPS